MNNREDLFKCVFDREIGNSFSMKKDYIKAKLPECNRIKTLYQRDLKYHTGCVNAICFSPQENFFASGNFNKNFCKKFYI